MGPARPAGGGLVTAARVGGTGRILTDAEVTEFVAAQRAGVDLDGRYRDPATIDVAAWDGDLAVPRAGEVLYRLR